MDNKLKEIYLNEVSKNKVQLLINEEFKTDYPMTLSEGSLTRIMDRINNKNLDYAIITAYRAFNSKKENIQLNRDLRHELNNKFLGVYPLVGHWFECPDEYSDWRLCPKELLTEVIERSYLIIRPESFDVEEFRDYILYLSSPEKYNQNAVVMKIKDLDMNGVYNYEGIEYEKFENEEMTLFKTARAYSQYVKKMEVPFVFEGLEIPNCTSFAKNIFWKEGFRWN